MAKNGPVTVNQYTWTEITANNITEATWQVIGAYDVQVQGTNGQTAPTEPLDGITYLRKGQDGESTLRSLAVLWPGIAGANRLYAKSIGGGSKVFISHA